MNATTLDRTPDPVLDPVFAAAVERQLAGLGAPKSALARNRRRVRGLTLGIGGVALAAALTGGAIFVANLPGTTTYTTLGDVVLEGTYTGTATLDLGAPPEGADVVFLDITCTEGGDMSVRTAGPYESGAEWNCSNPIRKDTIHINDGRMPDPGTSTITITADAGTEWSVVARYASAYTSEWGVNANGQTYGVPNDSGIPDLTAAQATNGKIGYILQDDLWNADGKSTIPVYESDGTTVIGEFPLGDQ